MLENIIITLTLSNYSKSYHLMSIFLSICMGLTFVEVILPCIAYIGNSSIRNSY